MFVSLTLYSRDLSRRPNDRLSHSQTQLSYLSNKHTGSMVALRPHFISVELSINNGFELLCPVAETTTVYETVTDRQGPGYYISKFAIMITYTLCVLVMPAATIQASGQ